MFPDIQTHWSKDCIQQLVDRAIVRGYPDGSFKPDNLVTRAEFAVLLTKAFPNTAPIRNAIAFKDVPANHWAQAAIQAATRGGFFSGYPDGTFKPSLPIPRVQVLVALASGLQIPSHPNPNEVLPQYLDDAAAVPNYARRAVASTLQRRLVVNYPQVRRFNPEFNASRGEVAALLCRALELPGVPYQYVAGLVAIAPTFDAADNFIQGLARVRVGEKWGYIEPSGKLVIPAQYDAAESFVEGVALVRTNRAGWEERQPDTPPMEMRGIWITTTASPVLFSRNNIKAAVDFLADTGFNTIFPVVWNQGATMYPSKVMKETCGLEIDARFAGRDPLKELIEEAKRVGLAVVPWFEYGFASSYSQKGGRIIQSKPNWGARDAKGNLLTKNSFDWLNAFNPEVQGFLRSLMLEVANNYEIQGIQGDDRFPALPSEGGYDAATVQRYTQQFGQAPPQNPKDPQWVQWRSDLLTDFLMSLYRDVINLNPNLLFSLSPSVYPWGHQEYLQDSQSWVDRGLVDTIHPQAYRRNFTEYKQIIDRLLVEQFTAKQKPLLSPGILVKAATYRISAEHLIQKIEYNRSRGLPGEVLFFYEGLREDSDALAKALKSGPYAKPAPFDARSLKQYGFTDRRRNVKYSYLDLSGSPIVQPPGDEAQSYSGNIAPVKQGYKWAYFDSVGRAITRYEYDEADRFSEGLAKVKIGKKYGYINPLGQRVIPPQFDDAGQFTFVPQPAPPPVPQPPAAPPADTIPSGNATPPGNPAPTPSPVDTGDPPPAPPIEALAPVKMGGRWGYILKNGTFLIPAQFDAAGSFFEGLARVKLAEVWGYIDPIGQQVIPLSFKEAGDLSDDFAAVKIEDKWGYIDKKGTVTIAPRFEDARSFKEGVAIVKLNQKWGYINKAGLFILQPEFDEANSFMEGVAAVKTGEKWGYIQIQN